MATIGVLAYAVSQTNGLRQTIPSISKTKTSAGNNNNNMASSRDNMATTKKQRNLVIVRKKQRVQPLSDSQTNVLVQNTVATTSSVENLTASNVMKIVNSDSISAGKVMKSKGSTLPLAVARRNARERNRVKQVNNGFAALRERIPDEVAECFESSHGNRRDATKKLSKVETLRMAVEYIRSLEKVLEIDNELKHYTTIVDDTPNTSPLPSSISVSSQPAESSLTDFEDETTNLIQETTSLAEITIINGHQYIRIPGTNTYHLLSSAIYQNEENIQPLSNQPITAIIQQQSDYENQSMLMCDSSSATLAMANDETDIKPELYLLANPSFDGVLTLKTEITDDDMLMNSQPLSTESIIETMEWWDSSAAHSNSEDVSS